MITLKDIKEFTLKDIKEAIDNAQTDMDYMVQKDEEALKLANQAGADAITVTQAIDNLVGELDFCRSRVDSQTNTLKEANALIGWIYRTLKEPTGLVLDEEIVAKIEASTWGKVNAIVKDVLK